MITVNPNPKPHNTCFSTITLKNHVPLDRFTQHRYKADQAFLLSKTKSPVGAYLDIDSIVQICKENGVEAVHPGYGFLSENEKFAAALERNGIKFVGPTVENLRQFGDKTSAKELAIAMDVPVIAGSDDAFPQLGRSPRLD